MMIWTWAKEEGKGRGKGEKGEEEREEKSEKFGLKEGTLLGKSFRAEESKFL